MDGIKTTVLGTYRSENGNEVVLKRFALKGGASYVDYTTQGDDRPNWDELNGMGIDDSELDALKRRVEGVTVPTS